MNYHKLKDVINMKFMGQSEARHQLLEYVEKQEPKNAIDNGYENNCPVCGERLDLLANYCSNCGQRVWYE